MKCHNLKAISLPESVTEIKESAFSECTSLAMAEVGSALAKLGSMHFTIVDCVHSGYARFLQ